MPQKGSAYGNIFEFAEPGSPYYKVLKANMDSESRVTIQEGLETVANEPRQAYFYLLQATLAIIQKMGLECQVPIKTGF